MVALLDCYVHITYYHVYHIEENNQAVRHKHLQLDQDKLNRAKAILGAKSETETVDRALKLVVSEADIDTVLRKARSKPA